MAMAKGREGGGRAPRHKERVACRYRSVVIDGKVRGALRIATSRDGGGLLHPDSIDAKSGKRVKDVLRDKRPAMQIPEARADEVVAFEPFACVPAPLQLDCGEATATCDAKGLSGGAGPEIINSRDLKGRLLYHGKASQALREELAAWVEWLANERPPWTADWATKNYRFAVLDTRQGTRPVGITSVWDRAISKLALTATGLNTKTAYDSKHLCTGLEAGIEDAVHAMLEQSTADGSMQFWRRRWTRSRQNHRRRQRTTLRSRDSTLSAARRTSGPGCSRQRMAQKRSWRTSSSSLTLQTASTISADLPCCGPFATTGRR